MVVPARTATRVTVQSREAIPHGRDFQFSPHPGRLGGLQRRVSVYSAIVDSAVDFVFVRNDTNFEAFIPARTRVGTVSEITYQGAYHVNPVQHELAALSDMPISLSDFHRQGLAARKSTSPIPASLPRPEIPDDTMERKSPAGATLYGTAEQRQRYDQLLSKHGRLFEDKGTTVKVPESEHMPVTLLPGSEAHRMPTITYPLSSPNRAVVDKAFDALHAQGKMSYTTQPTPFGFPVFVVWKTTEVDGQTVRKGRAVVDIRGLNKLVVKDSYPLPRQEDIVTALKGSRFITTIDAVSFFYQWQVAQVDRHKFTVNSYRGQEQLGVAIMGFANSVQYVQRQLDRILKKFNYCSRAYIDDIVIYSRTFEDHLLDLDRVFRALDEVDISISPAKTFVGFPSTKLLGQRVSGLGYTTHEEKVKAILDLPFPRTLKDLEFYVGITGWQRHYIPYFSQLVAPFEARKKHLLRLAPANKGNPRKRYVTKTLAWNEDENLVDVRRSYNLLQEIYRQATFLHHADPNRPLYVDLDSSRHGHAAVIYMVVDDPVPDPVKPLRFAATAVQPVLFLSKALSDIESRYPATELEVSGLL
ncbi:hypothetical protein CBER1_11528 [Cercospora berteroae]|uniref:Reverse transcriptase domain-containing protein n=1 Tax=Cercospora berteroae TaxID=357750 RepID=A0A2S6CH10_9PEZI|nr:hypothetical protein CBER1_11528 [Cercospora berteroae]